MACFDASHPVSLCCDRRYVMHGLNMPHCNTVMAGKAHSSYGTVVLDHLAADGAGLTGGQVTVVAVGQVDADLLWCPFYTTFK